MAVYVHVMKNERQSAAQCASVTTSSFRDEREFLKVSLLPLVSLRGHRVLHRIFALHEQGQRGVYEGLVVGTTLRHVYSFVPLRQCGLHRRNFA